MTTYTYDYRTEIAEVIAEKTTRQFTFTVLDETGTALPAASLSSLKLTLWNKDLGKTAIATDRDILNLNGGTVDSSGNGTLVLSSADNALVNAAVREETHVAQVTWGWSSDTKFGRAEIVFRVANLEKTT